MRFKPIFAKVLVKWIRTEKRKIKAHAATIIRSSTSIYRHPETLQGVPLKGMPVPLTNHTTTYI